MLSITPGGLPRIGLCAPPPQSPPRGSFQDPRGQLCSMVTQVSVTDLQTSGVEGGVLKLQLESSPMFHPEMNRGVFCLCRAGKDISSLPEPPGRCRPRGSVSPVTEAQLTGSNEGMWAAKEAPRAPECPFRSCHPSRPPLAASPAGGWMPPSRRAGQSSSCWHGPRVSHARSQNVAFVPWQSADPVARDHVWPCPLSFTGARAGAERRLSPGATGLVKKRIPPSVL